MTHSATATPTASVVEAITPPASTTFGANPAMQAARIGQQAYALLASDTVAKTSTALATALSVTEQQITDGINAYLFIMTGWDLAQETPARRRSSRKLAVA